MPNFVNCPDFVNSYDSVVSSDFTGRSDLTALPHLIGDFNLITAFDLIKVSDLPRKKGHCILIFYSFDMFPGLWASCLVEKSLFLEVDTPGKRSFKNR